MLTIAIERATEVSRAMVGGKAAGLARMISAGVPVPRGFVVTTSAYREFMTSNRLDSVIDQLLEGVDYSSPASVAALSQAVSKEILAATMPPSVRAEVAEQYLALGSGGYVAVRSSGVAEDMGDASFAGLYDSFLDIRGVGEVIHAVQRCWASLWTARCIAYRDRLGIGRDDALVAVVVQQMVVAETAGVLFTANPLNARTDEMVINSTWGLGEAIASGLVTPDELIVDVKTLTVKRSTLGSKLEQIVRNPDGPGTLHREAPADLAELMSMSDAQAAALCRLGQNAVELAGGVPQDVEWAYADGEFLILQSRDITGSSFLWEEDLEEGPQGDASEDITWSNIWAQEFWTGAITPIFYSIRGEEMANSDKRLFTLWGMKRLIPLRRFKYHRATAYFNSDADREYYRIVLPASLRGGKLSNLPPDWREAAHAARWDFISWIRMFVRMRLRTSDHGPFRQASAVYRFIETKTNGAIWPSADALREYSDREVQNELESKMKMFEDYLTLLRPLFHVYSAIAFALLQKSLTKWYTGTNDLAFADLLTGLPRRTAMMQEVVDVWKLGEEIRESPILTSVLDRFEGSDFFAHLESSPEGRAFLDRYREFIIKHGHRGHQDRDLWHARRCEDPMIDYRTFVGLVKAASPSPEHMEEQLNSKREGVTREVLGSIRAKRFGTLKAWAVERLLKYIYVFLVLRDDERPFADLITFAKKRAVTELGRRLYERGLIRDERDYYFLGRSEIYAVLSGNFQPRLIQMKITERRSMFDRFMAREEIPAEYLRGGVALEIGDSSFTDEEGVFQGTGTSRGAVRGIARVIPDLDQIGNLQKGEILICNSTDPGWASAFGLISGLVIEAGGMLSHGACLSREYGLPAVTLRGAMRKIPDGAPISVNGDTGKVTLLND